MSIRQTATGTWARADCRSMRSAIVFANASKSMIIVLSKLSFDSGSGSPIEAPQVGPEAIFRLSGTMEAALEQGLETALGSRPADRVHASVPAGGDLHVRWQAGGIHEALGVCDRPFVERCDASRELIDEAVELVVRQCSVHIAIGFREIAADVVGAQQHFQSTLPAHQPGQARHGSSAGGQADAHLPLRQACLLAARKTH